jgi:hypothetical protein
MKQIILLLIVVFISLSSNAQDVFDPLRYSFLNPVGTARSQSIGNAGVSLGGDFSSTFINPAGLGQFKTNEFVFTPGFFMNRNKHAPVYNDSTYKGNRSNLNIGNIGFVFSSVNRWGSSRVKNTTVSLAVTQQANYNSNFSYRGRTTTSSYSEKWVEELFYNDERDFDAIRNRYPGGSALAVENYLVDTLLLNGVYDGWRTNADTRFMALNQSFTYQTRGGMYEGALGVAWNNNEKLLYGITIGIPFINYSRTTTVNETDVSGNTNNDFASFRFTEEFSTRGAGLNAKLGLIYKPVERIRLGITFHTPSVLILKDQTNASLTADVENYAKRINNDNSRPSVFTTSTQDLTDGQNYTYEYQLVTPWRAAVSASFVFREIKDVTKQKGFITADVELVNYKAASYATASTVSNPGEEDYFKSLNNSIDNIYKAAVNARIGGEVKFKTIMVRGGFNYMGNPYKDKPEGAVNNRRLTPSLGLGYRDKGLFLDLTYAHTFGREFHVPYLLNDNGSPFANNNFSNGQVVATVGFKF